MRFCAGFLAPSSVCASWGDPPTLRSSHYVVTSGDFPETSQCGRDVSLRFLCLGSGSGVAAVTPIAAPDSGAGGVAPAKTTGAYDPCAPSSVGRNSLAVYDRLLPCCTHSIRIVLNRNIKRCYETRTPERILRLSLGTFTRILGFSSTARFPGQFNVSEHVDLLDGERRFFTMTTLR